MKVGLLSGAFSGDSKWSKLKKHMPSGSRAFHIPYNPLIDLSDTVDAIEKDLTAAGHDHGDIILIGHSMGGVIAAELAARLPIVMKTITVASPFGGIQGAGLMEAFTRYNKPFNAFWKNLQPDHPVLKSLQKTDFKNPMLCIAIENDPVFHASDGVVTLNSQYALQSCQNVEYKILNATHSEAIEDDKVIEEIYHFLPKTWRGGGRNRVQYEVFSPV